MDRYDSWSDHYCYPGTNVLVNRYGIKDLDLLEEAERSVTTLTAQNLILSRPPFSLTTLCQIHHTLFSELYSWAGSIRDIAISKGRTRFCQPQFIVREAGKLFLLMEKEHWLQQYEHLSFCQRLAWYYCELNVLHPFREGNGRSLRVLFEQIAIHAGYQISWAGITPEDWITANILGYESGPEHMCSLLLKHTLPL